MKKKKLLSVLVAAALSLSCFTAVPIVSQAADTTGVNMYRLYNPNSGEHFYTKSLSERDNLKRVGWKDEGEGWTAPETSNTPVYRLYNPNAGEHHYTTAMNERNNLVSAGWKDEGIGWYSDDAKSVPVYREYNPNATTGTHNYTTSKSEHDNLVSLGWKDEGIGWYGITEKKDDPVDYDVLDDGTYVTAPTDNGYSYEHGAVISDDLRMLTIHSGWNRFDVATYEEIPAYPKKEYRIPISENCRVRINAQDWDYSGSLSDAIDNVIDHDLNLMRLQIWVRNGMIVEIFPST